MIKMIEYKLFHQYLKYITKYINLELMKINLF